MRVFVVWEPILVSDWRRPTTGTLGRIPDWRAAQFWDPDHLVAQELRKAADSNAQLPKPSCCVSRGYFWDLAAIFPPQARANGMLASPIFFNGAVVGQESAIRTKLAELLSSEIPRMGR